MMAKINMYQGVTIRMYWGNDFLTQYNVVQLFPRVCVNKASPGQTMVTFSMLYYNPYWVNIKIYSRFVFLRQ